MILENDQAHPSTDARRPLGIGVMSSAVVVEPPADHVRSTVSSDPSAGRRPRWSPTPLLIDAVCLFFLAVVAYFQFFRRAASMPLSDDGFMVTLMLRAGQLPPLILGDLGDRPHPFAGRPFIGLGWNLAHLLGGGSVTGYYVFMFCCLALSSVVIYAMVRTAAPHQPIWAFVAAALKLVWIANYQIFADHSLAIYFAELLFWISTCALVALLRRPHIRVPMVLVVALHGIMALGLLVTIRTYEASWSIIPLVPLIAIALLSPIWRARSTVMPLVVWYAASLLALGTAFAQHNLLMIVAQATRQNAVLDSDVGLPFGVRFINGLAAVTVDSFTVPAVEIFRTLAGDTTAFSRYSMVPNRVVVAISILGFLALYIFGSAKMKILRRRSSARRLTDLGSSRYGAVSGRLGVAGCLVMVAGVAPLALWTDPVYGTRYIHWATFGTIILVLAACVWTVGRWGRAGVVISGLSLATIFGGSSFYMDQIGTSGEVQGAGQRTFWQQVVDLVPGVSEGSVVILEDSPRFMSLPDGSFTAIVRGFTGTSNVWALAEGDPNLDIDPDGRAVVLTRTNLVFQGVASASANDPPSTPPGADGRRDVAIDRDSVIWLRWRPESMRLELLESRSSLRRLERATPSSWGRELFPPGETIPALGYRLEGVYGGPEAEEQRLREEIEKLREDNRLLQERVDARTQRIEELERTGRSKDRDLKDARREIERLQAR